MVPKLQSIATALLIAHPFPEAAIAQQGGGTKPPSAVVSVAGVQQWQYEHALICQTENVDAIQYLRLIITRLRALGQQGFELVNAINHPVPTGTKAEACMYAVLKRPAPK